MRIALTISLILLTTILHGQNNYFNLGLKGNGICAGNSSNYNGIRLNLWDKNVNSINGLTISGLSQCIQSNGIQIGGLAAYAKKHNGLVISGLFIGGDKYNGVGITGLSPFADTLNGLFVGLWGVTPWSRYDTIHVVNGIAIGGLGVYASKLNGLAIAILRNTFDKLNGVSIACFNTTEEFHGFQFGLLNYAGNNRKLFRWTPFFNFNLRKKQPKVESNQE